MPANARSPAVGPAGAFVTQCGVPKRPTLRNHVISPPKSSGNHYIAFLHMETSLIFAITRLRFALFFGRGDGTRVAVVTSNIMTIAPTYVTLVAILVFSNSLSIFPCRRDLLNWPSYLWPPWGRNIFGKP
jgi:hypothetical protein